MKKTLLALAAAGALALSLGMAACGTPEGSTEEVRQMQNAYGISAVTAGLYIAAEGEGSEQPADPAPEVPEEAPEQPADPAPEVPEEAPEQPADPAPEVPEEAPEQTETPVEESGFDRYLALAEGILTKGGYTETVSASDREGYALRMDAEYAGFGGSALSYVMYYNETAKIDDDFDDDFYDDFDDDFDDDGETEEDYILDGVMIIDGAEYEVFGERSSEYERGEEEGETELRVRLSEGRTMYIEQSYERDGDEYEREYTYIVRERGREVARSTFSYEQEGAEEELKMSYSADGVRGVFYFDRETYRGREVIRIRAAENGQTVQYIARAVRGEDGSLSYEYEQVAPRR